MKDNYKYKLYLKKEDDFNKSFNKYLSHPIPKNLKYEVENDIFFLENFIKINWYLKYLFIILQGL